LTDKGQNRLYGGEIKISICWRQRQAIWGKSDDILFAGNGGSTLTGGDGKDLFVIAAAETLMQQLATSKRVLMLLG